MLMANMVEEIPTRERRRRRWQRRRRRRLSLYGGGGEEEVEEERIRVPEGGDPPRARRPTDRFERRRHSSSYTDREPRNTGRNLRERRLGMKTVGEGERGGRRRGRAKENRTGAKEETRWRLLPLVARESASRRERISRKPKWEEKLEEEREGGREVGR